MVLWASPVTKPGRVTLNFSLGPTGSLFSDTFMIKRAACDKSSSNLVGFILNCEKNISWSHSGKSFSSKWYSLLKLISSTKRHICLLKFGVIRLIGNYSRDLVEIKLTFLHFYWSETRFYVEEESWRQEIYVLILQVKKIKYLRQVFQN